MTTFNHALSQRIWPLLFISFCTLLVAFGVREGYEFAEVNHFRDQSVQLPILYSYADQSLFPNDILLQARGSYITWLYPALGLMSRFMPLYFLMLGLYILSIGLMLAAVYFLAETLFPKRHVGIVAALLWTVWLPNPGGDFLQSAFPTHTTTAIGVQLLGLVLGLRGRPLWGALLLGLAANINAMTTVFVGACWAAYLIGNRAEWSWRLLGIPVVMLIAASPVLWWRFGNIQPAERIPMEQFVEIMRLRLWYAVFPLSVNVSLWGLFAGVVALWWVACRYASPETNRKVFWMIQGSIVLLLIGTIFTEIIPLELVIQLQLLRGTWMLNLLAMLYFSNMISVWMNGTRREVLQALLLTLVLAAPRIILERFPLPQPTPYTAYLDLDAVRDGITPLGMLSLITLALGTLWTLRKTIQQQVDQKQRLSLWFAFALVILIAPLFIDTAVPDNQRTITRAWRQTLTWIADNTAKDASFVAPPTLDGFRVYAQRTSFSDWKDGTLLIFNGPLAVEWMNRMEALGFDEDQFAFQDLTTADLCHVRQDYDLDYAVVFNHWDIDGQAIFQNRTFSVIPMNTLNCDIE